MWTKLRGAQNHMSAQCKHDTLSPSPNRYPLDPWSDKPPRIHALFVPANATRFWTRYAWPPATFVTRASFSNSSLFWNLHFCCSLDTRDSVKIYVNLTSICVFGGNWSKMIMHSIRPTSLYPDWRRCHGPDASSPQGRHQHNLWCAKKFPASICREYGVTFKQAWHEVMCQEMSTFQFMLVLRVDLASNNKQRIMVFADRSRSLPL